MGNPLLYFRHAKYHQALVAVYVSTFREVWVTCYRMQVFVDRRPAKPDHRHQLWQPYKFFSHVFHPYVVTGRDCTWRCVGV